MKVKDPVCGMEIKAEKAFAKLNMKAVRSISAHRIASTSLTLTRTDMVIQRQMSIKRKMTCKVNME